jgi:hypothetical protein
MSRRELPASVPAPEGLKGLESAGIALVRAVLAAGIAVRPLERS